MQGEIIERRDKSTPGSVLSGYCTLRIELDKKKAVDATFIYANEELSDIALKSPENLVGKSLFEIFPSLDKNCLESFFDCAYQRKSINFDSIYGENRIHTEAYPVGEEGLCACLFQKKSDGKNLEKAYEEERKRNSRIRHYAKAMGIVYPLVIAIDYKENRYVMLEYDNFLNKTAPFSGTADELVDVGASTIPDSETAEKFRSLFRRENAIKAFKSGKKELRIRHMQNGDDGRVHYMDTHVICTECTDERITAISLSKCIDEEKERDDALKEASEHAAVIEALSTIYTTIIEAELKTHRFKIIQTNSPFKTVTGGKEEGNFDLVMENVLNFYMHPDDIDRMREFINLETVSERLGKDTTLVTEYRSPYGKWFESRFISKKRNEEGHVISAIYCARDVTPEKLKELHYREQLKEQLAVFDALARNFKNAFLVDMTSATTKILKAEDEFVSYLFGDGRNNEFDYKTLMTRCVRSVVHPDDQEMLLSLLSIENLRKVFREKEEYNGNYRRVGDGRFLNYQFTVRLAQDRVHLIMGFQNVDSIIREHLEEERKQREKENAYQNQLEEQLLISRTLARNFKNIYLVDLDKETATILKLEAGYEELKKEGIGHEFPFDAVLRHWIDNVVYPDDRAEVNRVFEVENVRKRLSENNEFTGNYRSAADGDIHYFQYSMSRVNDSKAILGFQNIDDIIRQQLEEEEKRRVLEIAYQEKLKAALEEAERANKSKTDFLLRMSHDIRTPLNGIRGMIDIADYYGNDLEKVRECRSKVRECSDILLELINEVLDMSKLESGEVVLERVPFDLSDIAFEIFTVISKQAEERGIEIKEEFNVSNTRFIGSPVHFKRLLMNILGNAIKYNRPHGKIFISCREVSFDGKKSVFETIVRDTGIGMSEDFQKHLFEPFQQENASVRTKYGGTGLGLSIAKNLTDKMGGTIECESRKDVGTTFTIRLPFEVDFSENSGEEESEENYSIAGETIILAEDNEINLEIARFILENAEARVIVAHNGEEAVNAFAVSECGGISCILMDIMMPLMDGYEASRRIRSMKRKDAATIPIIAMTANAFVEDRIATKKAGMNAHISKPLDGGRVIRTIAEEIKKEKEQR